MRIAVITNSFPPQRGGAASIAFLQVEILRNAGHEVRVWNPHIDWLDKSTPIRLLRHLMDLFPRTSLQREVIGWNPDVLMTHNMTGCGFGTGSAIQARGFHWVHFLHDVQLFEPSGKLINPSPITFWQKFWSFLRRWTFGTPDLVISPTRWLADEHRRRGFFTRSAIEILPNPSPVAEFVPRMPQEPMQLLLVGASREKGLDFIKTLLAQLPFEAHLDVVGAGMPGDAHIQYHGSLENAVVLELMKRADALLVPSTIAENQPTVILEASSVGLPVIAANVGGISETMDGSGLLCPEGDLAAWTDSIVHLRDAGAYANQASRMYELARRHDPVAYAAEFNQLISNL
jgi:glycosyltransferase involved in cell wall biosynthesis